MDNLPEPTIPEEKIVNYEGTPAIEVLKPQYERKSDLESKLVNIRAIITNAQAKETEILGRLALFEPK